MNLLPRTQARRLRPSEAAARQRAADAAAARSRRRDDHDRSREPRPSLVGPPGLRVEWHRTTMAHLRSVYPFHADAGFGCRGPYVGVNVSGGMSAFHFDPFELYGTVLTNPNIVVVGDVGMGKSALVKAFLLRELIVYGRRRFVVVLDPKGEYQGFAGAAGLAHIRLHPGGHDRLNPMDPPSDGQPTDTVDRQDLAAGLISAVLGRSLDPTEDAVLGWAIASLARSGRPFTLADVTGAVAEPASELVELARATPLELQRAARPVLFALDKLCSRTLRGMFDGPTTIGRHWADGPGLVIDLSAVYANREALPLVMMAATTWLRSLLQRQWQRRVLQVIEEAWAAVLHGAAHMQASLKLSRTYGVATVVVVHNVANLTAQADDGTASAKIAAGLLSDIQTRVLLRQPADQLAAASALFGLNDRQTGCVGHLVRGRALWRLQDRAALVHTILTAADLDLFDTDAAMSS